ncbi:MAG: branched-chain amino acid ABC transporter permease [Myxococcales bacterium]|nr:branched-chain amino acid ABC transporter permease [Myxococcales bacterium]
MLATDQGRRTALRVLGVVIVVAIMLRLPKQLSDYHVFQLTQIVVYAIAVLGLNLLTGFTGQLSLGNGAFFAIGSYVAVIVVNKLGVPYWITPALAGLVCFGAGYVFGRSAARLEGLYLALATFALATAFPQILKLDRLEPWTGGNQGLVISKPASPLGWLTNDQWLYYVCLAVAAVMVVIAWNLIRGRTGRALVALRDHPIAAATMGVDVATYKSIAFGVSAAYTGVAGALAALVSGFISPDSFTILLSIQIVVGGVIGGITSIYGAMFGAAFILLVPDVTKKASEVAQSFGLPALATRLENLSPAVLFGLLLILFMMVMPDGLAGMVRVVRTRLARAQARSTRT